tara:strand:- start:182 stop:364 length:183 start_codon:yes stop_codon:yes gene_type:complete
MIAGLEWEWDVLILPIYSPIIPKNKKLNAKFNKIKTIIATIFIKYIPKVLIESMTRKFPR